MERAPKFSKTFPGSFTVLFNYFGPEISEFLVEWKAPLVNAGHSTFNACARGYQASGEYNPTTGNCRELEHF